MVDICADIIFFLDSCIHVCYRGSQWLLSTFQFHSRVTVNKKLSVSVSCLANDSNLSTALSREIAQLSLLISQEQWLYFRDHLMHFTDSKSIIRFGQFAGWGISLFKSRDWVTHRLTGGETDIDKGAVLCLFSWMNQHRVWMFHLLCVFLTWNANTLHDNPVLFFYDYVSTTFPLPV